MSNNSYIAKPKVTKRCIICNNSFTTSLSFQKYCSDPCRRKFEGSSIITKICLRCGKEFRGNYKRVNNVYCSSKCQAMKRNHLDMGKPIVREYFLERANFQCEECGHIGELEMHHVEPLYMGGEDVVENIKALCHSCHMAKHGVS